MNMNIKNNYALLAAFAMVWTVSGLFGMQSSNSLVQEWYKPHIKKTVDKLNFSFAQLIGAAQDEKPHEEIRKHAKVTIQELKSFNNLVEQFGWCPLLLDRATKEIQKVLFFSDTVEHAQLERNFIIAHDMKNWLLASCNQTEKKHQASEYNELKLLLIEKQHLEACEVVIKDKYETINKNILTQKQAPKLSGWGEFWFNIYEQMPHVNSEKYKAKLLNNEILAQEKQLEKQLAFCDEEMKTVDIWKEKETQRLQKEFLGRNITVHRQMPAALVFKNKQTGLPNIFFEVILQLFSASSRKDILIGEQFVDSYSPVRYVSRKAASLLASLGFSATHDPQKKSTGHEVVDAFDRVDTILFTQNMIGEFPVAVGCKCLSMLLTSPKLQNVIVGIATTLGQAQEVQTALNDLCWLKKNSSEMGLSLNDMLVAAKLIGEDRLGMLVRICFKAIKKQPEKFAGYLDGAADYVYGSAKTALDDDSLLSYIAAVNEESHIVPIREIKPTWSEIIYNHIVDKKTVTVIGCASLIYGGYRYDAHKLMIRKAQELPVKDSLKALGAWAYNWVPTLFKN